jgi:hypothetical protein
MKKLLSCLLILVAGCSPESNIKPTIDRVGENISVQVIFHDNRASLEEAYRVSNNLASTDPVPEQWGFSVWNMWLDADGNQVDLPGRDYRCTVHSFHPKSIDDQHVRTLGHELLHCVYGSYHR